MTFVVPLKNFIATDFTLGFEFDSEIFSVSLCFAVGILVSGSGPAESANAALVEHGFVVLFRHCVLVMYWER